MNWMPPKTDNNSQHSERDSHCVQPTNRIIVRVVELHDLSLFSFAIPPTPAAIPQ